MTVVTVVCLLVAVAQTRAPQRLTLFAPHKPPALEAYGWHVDSTPDARPWISKGGGSDDFASQLLYYPRDRVTIVWASNNLRQRWRQTLKPRTSSCDLRRSSHVAPGRLFCATRRAELSSRTLHNE